MTAEWTTRRLSRATRLIHPIAAVSTTRVALEHIEPWTGRLILGAPEPEAGPGNKFSAGNILFGKLRPYLAKVWVADRDGVYFGDFLQLAVRPGVNSRFLGYSLRSPDFISIASSESSGSKMPRTEWERMRDLRVCIPDLHSQSRAVDYLDHETAEIDAFVDDLEGSLRLLNDRWESNLIRAVQVGESSDIVATGLATWPHAARSWQRTRLKATASYARNGAWGFEPGVDEVTVRCIRVADFDKTHGSIHDANLTDRSYPCAVVSESALEPGDLVLEKSGGGPTTPVGNVVKYAGTGGAMYSNFVARIKVAPAVDPSYALRLHQAIYSSGVTARSIKQTTGIQNLDATSYFNEPIFLPPLEEQQVIAEHLDHLRRDIDEASEDINSAITLAKERRAALIAAAVTGQIDVMQKHRPVAEQLEEDLVR